MTKYELIKAMRSTLRVLDENEIKGRDYRFVDMYEDWMRLKSEGHKYIYIIHYLAQQYELSESSVERTIRKFSEETKI